MMNLKRYGELAEEVKPTAMENYINEFCAYAEVDGEVTAYDIEENGIVFTEDGEIWEV